MSLSRPSAATTPRAGARRRRPPAATSSTRPSACSSEQGYAATTMDAIAAEARRRAQDRLRGVRDQERPAARALEPPAARRPRRRRRSPSRRWYREVLEEPDPERQLRLNARNSRTVKVRIARRARGDPRRGPGRPRHRRALEPHPDRVPRQPARDRREPRRARTRSPRASTSTRAADILWTLNHPNVWQLLVGERGWTPERYESGSRTPPARSCCVRRARASPGPVRAARRRAAAHGRRAR